MANKITLKEKLSKLTDKELVELTNNIIYHSSVKKAFKNIKKFTKNTDVFEDISRYEIKEHLYIRHFKKFLFDEYYSRVYNSSNL